MILNPNGKVGQYVLPKNVCAYCCPGNPVRAIRVLHTPMPHLLLLTLLVHLEIPADFEAWLEWAVLNKVSEDVVGYIPLHKADLFDFDPVLVDMLLLLCLDFCNVL